MMSTGSRSDGLRAIRGPGEGVAGQQGRVGSDVGEFPRKAFVTRGAILPYLGEPPTPNIEKRPHADGVLKTTLCKQRWHRHGLHGLHTKPAAK